MPKKPKPKTICQDCNGTGVVPFGTDMLKCDACNGTGKK